MAEAVTNPEQAKKFELITLRDTRIGEYAVRVGHLYNVPGSEFELKFLFNKGQIGGDGFSEVYFRTYSGNIFMLDDQGNLLNANESAKHKKAKGLKLDKEELSKIKISVGHKGLELRRLNAHFDITEMVTTNERLFSAANFPNIKTSTIVEEFQKKVPPRKIGDWERDPITHKRFIKTSLPDNLVDGVFDPHVPDYDILNTTIYSKDKKSRVDRFEDVWKKGWDPRAKYGYGYFQTEKSDSSFSRYSSKGWKIHIAFGKGREKEIAQSLFVNGLYFKLEGAGTYFNGKKASGATIYIGSYDNMEAISEYLERYVGYMLVEGSTQTIGGLKIQSGSGSDIEIRPKITARFDVAKTKHGIYGDKKYNEDGLASWTGLGGIPLLASGVKEARKIEANWNNYTPEQRQIYLQRLKSIYEESKGELIKDFGEEFVFGSKKTS